jgi:hypothetical protein
MPTITQIVTAINEDVVAKLAAAGYPALTDGQILIGRQHIYEGSAPPRIVFIPLSSKFLVGGLGTAGATLNQIGASPSANNLGASLRNARVTSRGLGYATAPTVVIDPPSVPGGVLATATATLVGGAVVGIVFTNYGSGYTSIPNISFTGGGGTGAQAVAFLGPQKSALAAIQQRSVTTEVIHFEVHCWGQTYPHPNPDTDFDFTQALYQQVIASTHLLAVGAVEFTDLKFPDQMPTATQLVKDGHEAIFGISLKTPVLDALLPLVPTGTVSQVNTYLEGSDGGSPEQGCTG